MRTSFFNKEKFSDPQVVERLQFFGTLSILAFMAALFAFFFWRSVQPKADFYNELWGPTYLLVHGQSPYNTVSLHPTHPSGWFPMAIGFFSPLGWLGEDTAMRVWFLLCTLELFTIVFLALKKSRAIHVTFLSALLAFSFPPTLYHVFLGQIGLTVALCMLLASYFVTKEKHWLVALLVAIGLAKPHLGSLAALGLSVYYFNKGRIRTLFAFYLRVALMVLLLCLPLFLAYPQWIVDMIAQLRSRPPYFIYPSLFMVLWRNMGTFGIILWALMVLSIFVLIYFLWKKLPPMHAVSWSLGLALLITPYIGSWDFVLLLPILILTFSRVGWKQKSFLILVYLLAWYAQMVIQRMEPSHNYFFWWVPPLFLGTAAILTPWKEYTQKALKIS